MMNLLSRNPNRIIPVVTLLAVVAFLVAPIPWAARPAGLVIGPSPAWATGSPDETLKPPPTPKKSGRVMSPQGDLQDSSAPSIRSMDKWVDVKSARLLASVLWRLYWPVLRF